MKGTIIRSTGSWYQVLTENGEVLDCRLKGKFRIQGIKSTNPIAVGDFVIISVSEKEEAVIQEILPRNNFLIRKATKLSKTLHIIASNMDHCFLVVTLAYPRTSTGFIDRFLMTAEAYNVPISLVFNKIDLYTEELKQHLDNMVNLYESLDYKCYKVSALTGEGIENLKENIKNKTVLFSGHSGVGKSALINKIDPKLQLRTGEISAYHEKGMHTTTFAEMLTVQENGFIIDTPGIKEFSMVEFKKPEISLYFREIYALIHDCKFHNCTHFHEPECAVIQAVEEGKIDIGRYSNYLSILNDEECFLADWEK